MNQQNKSHNSTPLAPVVRKLTVGQWFNRLTDYLREDFIADRAGELMGLYLDGMTVQGAAIYCRVYLLAPDVSQD